MNCLNMMLNRFILCASKTYDNHGIVVEFNTDIVIKCSQINQQFFNFSNSLGISSVNPK